MNVVHYDSTALWYIDDELSLSAVGRRRHDSITTQTAGSDSGWLPLEPVVRRSICGDGPAHSEGRSRCTYGCAILNISIAGLLTGVDTPLQDALDYVNANAPDELIDALRPIAQGESSETLETSGYVIHSLQTALHDGLTATSAEEAIVTAINRGGDTDIIGAIAGAVTGARFGASELPDR